MKGSHLIIIQRCWRISYFLAAALKNVASKNFCWQIDLSTKNFLESYSSAATYFKTDFATLSFPPRYCIKKKFDPNCLLFGKTDRLLCNLFHRTILITWQEQEKLGVSSITSGQSFWPSLYHVFLYSFSSFW